MSVCLWKLILSISPKDRITSLANEFYLAGGTGLALQIGHRDSVDFIKDSYLNRIY